MSLDNYGTAVELVMSKDKQDDFDAGAKKIRDTMVRHGFAQEAADQVSFTISQHTLTISDEQARSGAWHIQADGNPFYAVIVSAPGGFHEMVSLDSKNPTGMAPRSQAQYLAFEIGMNLMVPVKDVLKQMYGETDDRVAGGVSGGFEALKYETSMRCEPKTYMSALNDLVEYRLNMVAPIVTVAKKASPGSGFRP